MFKTHLGEVFFVFHIEGSDVQVDRELLERMARGTIASLTAEELQKRNISNVRAVTLGSRPLVTDQGLVAMMEKNKEADALAPAPSEPPETKPMPTSPNGKPNGNVKRRKNQ